MELAKRSYVSCLSVSLLFGICVSNTKETKFSSYNIRSQERGLAIMEFVLISPLLFLLVFGLIQYGLVFFTYITVKNATSLTARSAVLGRPALSNEQLVSIAVQAIAPSLDQNRLSVRIEDTNVGGLSGAKRVELSYNLQVFFPILFPNTSTDGTYIIRTEAIMR